MEYRRLYIEGGTYFFTVVTYRRQPMLRGRERVALLESVTEEVRARHPFEIVASVTMPNHVHAIWALPDGDHDFSTRWMLIKSRFSRLLAAAGAIKQSREARRGLPVWQNRFWEHAIRNEVELGRVTDYIHFNPVHHGFVKRPVDWPHSTFHRYVADGYYDEVWGTGEVPGLAKFLRGEI